MSKRLNGQEGIAASEELENIYTRYRNLRDDSIEKVDANRAEEGSIGYKIVKDIQCIINEDACLTPSQYHYVVILIQQAIAEVIKGANIDTIMLPIITFINSTRLACINCLNRRCKFRHVKQSE